MSTHHTWRFFRAGGFDQVRLETGGDLVALEQLDQKLWVALACPTTGLEFDSRTLALIDTDKDARIRAPEIIAATKWATSCLKNPDDLLKSSLPCPWPPSTTNIPKANNCWLRPNTSSSIWAKASDGHNARGHQRYGEDFIQTNFNGDGIVPVESATDDATKGIINDIITCLGPEIDEAANRSKPGEGGFLLCRIAGLFRLVKKAESDATVLPLGDKTAGAAAALSAVKAR